MNASTDKYEMIFRSSALHRHIKAREESILPKFVSRGTILFLWILLTMLIVSVVLAWITKIPVYVSGRGMIDWKDETWSEQKKLVLIALLSPDSLSYIHIGQRVFVKLTAAGGHLQGIITTIELETMSPDAVRDRFGFNDTLTPIAQPAAIAMLQLKPTPENLPILDHLKSVYAVDVEIGSRRVISLLPFVGQMFRQ